MEIVAHSLWATAAAVAVRRKTHARFHMGWTIWWAGFPDVLAFGTSIVAGLALLIWGSPGVPSDRHHLLPRAHLGLPLYAIGHSLVVFAVVFTIAAILARRPILSMLGWLLHILIDIPTHSYSYHPTQFLWPISDVGVNGIAWGTLWFWVATYAALAGVYFLLWKKGWLWRTKATAAVAHPGGAIE